MDTMKIGSITKRFKRTSKDTEPVWNMMELSELILVLPLEIYIHIYIYKYKIRFINQKYPEMNSAPILVLLFT